MGEIVLTTNRISSTDRVRTNNFKLSNCADYSRMQTKLGHALFHSIIYCLPVFKACAMTSIVFFCSRKATPILASCFEKNETKVTL